MRIEYWATLVRAWERMTVILFRPFDPVKWLVLGFCAFVAGLLDGGGGGNGGRIGGGPGHGPSGTPDVESILEALRHVLAALRSGWEWVMGHWGATLFVFVGLPLLLALILAAVWLSSRFKLIFLDNLAHGRANVLEPWKRLGRLGDSLFLFRLAFGVGAFFVGGALVALTVGLGIFSLASSVTPWGIAGLVVAGLVSFAFFVSLVYAALFLDSFVVPIMYRHNLTAVRAWKVFLPWLSAETGSFLLYGLFVLLLFVVAGTAVMVVAFGTCCVGLMLLSIPYVGTLLLLPLHVAYRYLSLEFLAQFHPSLSVFPTPVPVPPSQDEVPA